MNNLTTTDPSKNLNTGEKYAPVLSYATLTGPQKASVLLLSLQDEHLEKVMKMLDETEIRELSQSMSTLGQIKSEVVEDLYAEFSERVGGTGTLSGTFESTERLLKKVLGGDRVTAIMEELRGPAGRTIWDKLGNVDEDFLANFLKNEYPQTVAVIMSKLKREQAAKILAKLPDEMGLDVISRMLKMSIVQKEVIEDIENTLKNEFINHLAKTPKADSYEMMAEVFNSFDRATETKFMEALEEKSPDSAERIKSLMFTFEDLVKIDGSGIQTIIRTCDNAQLGMALKGAPNEIKDLFFSNMSERAGKLMKEDMESLGPVRLREVEEAQMAVVNQAKDLADRGEILIMSGDSEEEMIA